MTAVIRSALSVHVLSRLYLLLFSSPNLLVIPWNLHSLRAPLTPRTPHRLRRLPRLIVDAILPDAVIPHQFELQPTTQNLFSSTSPVLPHLVLASACDDAGFDGQLGAERLE